MSTIRKEVSIEARPETVWDALRDVGALHTRLAPGFVTDVRMEGGARIVTFGNGMVAREVIMSVDDDVRRLAWTIVGGRMTHHYGVAQVFDEGGGRSRFVWTTDLLPDAIAPAITGMMEQAMPIIKATLERSEREAVQAASANPTTSAPLRRSRSRRQSTMHPAAPGEPTAVGAHANGRFARSAAPRTAPSAATRSLRFPWDAGPQ